jgi:hypothetical protein
MNQLTLAILAIIGITNFCYSQDIVIDEPKELNDSINSNAEDIYPLLSPDGETLYFVRAFHAQNTGGEMAGQDIWFSKKSETGDWQTARNLTELNTEDNNVVVGISATQDTLYLLNTYSGPLRKNRGIAFSTLKGDTIWSDPEELNLRFRNNSPYKGYYVAPDGETIVVSADGTNSYGEEDLYIYVKENGKWNEPIHLSDTINTKGFEISPFLTEDKKMLFFASSGHGGIGDADIFMTTRLDSAWTNWSAPVNLGEGINSAAFDAYFSVHRNGEAFFSSNRNEKFAYIYTVNVTFKADSLPPSEEPEPVLAVVDTIPTETIAKETFYTVQILALKKRDAPEKDFFDKLDLNLITMYVGKDGFNRFSIGQYNGFSLALAEMKKLRASGYPDAFVRKVERYTELSIRQGLSIVSYYEARSKE